MLLCIVEFDQHSQFAVLVATSASHVAGVVMCDSNSHGRLCNFAHAEPAQEKSVIYRKKHVVARWASTAARTLPIIDGGGLAGL